MLSSSALVRAVASSHWKSSNNVLASIFIASPLKSGQLVAPPPASEASVMAKKLAKPDTVVAQAT